MFFREVVPGYYRFYSSYSGYYLHFTGLAVDEMRLIIAEVQARNGFHDQSMQTLNELLETRFVSGTYTPYTASSAREALEIVLLERRKQLIYRGVRWSDLRRLNQEPENQITLTRTIMGESHTLPPNDPRYIFSIPPDEINYSGIEQNPRQ